MVEHVAKLKSPTTKTLAGKLQLGLQHKQISYKDFVSRRSVATRGLCRC